MNLSFHLVFICAAIVSLNIANSFAILIQTSVWSVFSQFKLKMCKKASHVMGKLAIKMYKGFLGYMFSPLIKMKFSVII